MMDWVHEALSSQFFTGGALLGAAGVMLAYLRHLPSFAWYWIKRWTITEVEIMDHEVIYHWVLKWSGKRFKNIRTLSAHIQWNEEDTIADAAYNSKKYSERNDRPNVYFAPAPGGYFGFYKYRLFFLFRTRKDVSAADMGVSRRPRESFNIMILSRNVQLIRDLLDDCYDAAKTSDGSIQVMLHGEYGDWSSAGRRKIKKLDSVVLQDDQSARIFEDISGFLGRSDRYNSLGIPYRRGYLLYGKPGNGKTSLVVSIASVLRMNLYMLNLSASGMNDSKLLDSVASVPTNSIILLEDVDCAFIERKKSDKDQSALSFSGLLNVLDGVVYQEGRIIFLTTNYIDKLDPALVRPGRVDFKMELKNANKQQAKTLFLRFFPGEDKLAEQFASTIPDGLFNMATLQSHLITHQQSAVVASDTHDLPIGE